MDCKEEHSKTLSSGTPDAGWAWIVVGASFVSNIIVDGIVYGSGHALQPFWMDTFDVSDAEAVVPISLFIGTYFLGGPFAGAIADKWGLKTMAKFGCALSVFGFLCSAMATGIVGLCITLGLFTGFGFCMLYLASIRVISEYFNAKRALAMSIAVSGSGIGTFMFAPFIRYTLNVYGWRETMALLATIVLITFITALLYEPVTLEDIKKYPNDISNSAYSSIRTLKRMSLDLIGSKSSTTTSTNDETCRTKTCKKKKRKIFNFHLLRSPTFALLCFSTFFTLMGLFVPYIFLPRQAMARGFTANESTMLVSLLGIFNIIARLASGYYTDKAGWDPIMISNVCLMSAGFLTILVPTFYEYWLFVLFTIIFSVGSGSFAALRTLMCMELCGQRRLKQGWGLLMLFMGIGVVVGAPLAGALRDISGDFNTTFYVAGLLILFSGSIAWPMKKMKQWEVKKTVDKFGDEEMKNSGDDSSQLSKLPIFSSGKSSETTGRFKHSKMRSRHKKNMSRWQRKRNREIDELENIGIAKPLSPKSEQLKRMERENPQNLLAAMAGKEEAEKADTLRTLIMKQVLNPDNEENDQKKKQPVSLWISEKNVKRQYPEKEKKTQTDQTGDKQKNSQAEHERWGFRFWKGIVKSSSSPMEKDSQKNADHSGSDSSKSHHFWRSFSRSPKSVDKGTKRSWKTDSQRQLEAKATEHSELAGLKTDQRDPTFWKRSLTPVSTKVTEPVEPASLKPFGKVETGKDPREADEDSKRGKEDDSTKKSDNSGKTDSPYRGLMSNWFRGQKSPSKPGRNSRNQSAGKRSGRGGSHPSESKKVDHGGAARISGPLKVRSVRQLKYADPSGLATHSFREASKKVICGLIPSWPIGKDAKRNRPMKTPQTLTESLSPMKTTEDKSEEKKKPKKSHLSQKGYKGSRI